MVILEVKWADGKAISSFWLDSGEHFRSFFSTIWNRLEHRRWGSRFPVMMNKLFQGYADASDMDALAAELKVIQEEFRQLPVYELTWNYEKPDACPGWDAIRRAGSYLRGFLSSLQRFGPFSCSLGLHRGRQMAEYRRAGEKLVRRTVPANALRRGAEKGWTEKGDGVKSPFGGVKKSARHSSCRFLAVI